MNVVVVFFCYESCGHVFTGDLDIVSDSKCMSYDPFDIVRLQTFQKFA